MADEGVYDGLFSFGLLGCCVSEFPGLKFVEKEKVESS